MLSLSTILQSGCITMGDYDTDRAATTNTDSVATVDAAGVCYEVLFGANTDDVQDKPAHEQIRQHHSYHNISSQEQAELELKHYSSPDHKCYLTWWNESKQTYKVSVTTGGLKFHHLLLIVREEGDGTMYKMEGSSAQFNDAAMMLNFYENNPVGNLDGIGECVRPFNKSMSHPGKNFSDHQKHKIATKSASLDSIRKLTRTDNFFKLEKPPEASPEFAGQDMTVDTEEEFAMAVPRLHMKEMQKHPSFHGAMSKNEAELLLMHHGSDCYLTRYNTSKRTHVLSVKVLKEVDKDIPVFQHFQLVTHSEDGQSQYEIAGSEKKFDKVSKLLDYYQRNPVNYTIAGIGDYIKLDAQDSNLMLGWIRMRLNTDNSELSPDSPSEEINNEMLGGNANLVETPSNTKSKKLTDCKLKVCNTLCCGDIATIRDFFYGVRLKWYDLGIELKVSLEELDVIKFTNNNDPSVCLREMLRVWLKFIDNPPTWKAVADALAARAIDELALAKRAKKMAYSEEEQPDMLPAGFNFFGSHGFPISKCATWLNDYRSGLRLHH